MKQEKKYFINIIKNLKWYIFLFLLVFSHQIFYILTPSTHGCGADLPIEFLYKPAVYNNSFSGKTAITGPDGYSGAYVKVDCDIGGVIIPTGSPTNYILLENSNSIERPLHNLTAIPLRYVSTFGLRAFNIPIENSYVDIYLSRGKVFQLQFYLSWYYAHVLQNLLIIFITFYLFSKYIKLNFLSVLIFYSIFYIPGLGRDVLSPDMNLWIPFAIMLSFITYKEFENEKNRKKIILFTSFSILLYPIFMINFLYIGFLYLNLLLKKNLKLKQIIPEGLFLITPYFMYRLFLNIQEINFVPATMKYMNENIACKVYCQGVWMFIDANKPNGILNELARRLKEDFLKGEFNFFLILFLFFFILLVISKNKNILDANFSLLIVSVIIFLIFVGNFKSRYVVYIPSLFIVHALTDISKTIKVTSH